MAGHGEVQTAKGATAHDTMWTPPVASAAALHARRDSTVCAHSERDVCSTPGLPRTGVVPAVDDVVPSTMAAAALPCTLLLTPHASSHLYTLCEPSTWTAEPTCTRCVAASLRKCGRHVDLGRHPGPR